MAGRHDSKLPTFSPGNPQAQLSSKTEGAGQPLPGFPGLEVISPGQSRMAMARRSLCHPEKT